MAILKPDRIRAEKVGNVTITIKEKIIPDSFRAPKRVASYIGKDDPMKPRAKIGGDGKPRGITVHNTPEIRVPNNTTPAEQYVRATYNGNMAGAVVHFYVYKTDIWQELLETEQGWHAGDGSSRRPSVHAGKYIGGNLDTIAIECIGSSAETEAAAALLIAYLLVKYKLDVSDVYTHNFFMGLPNSIVRGARKNCPVYILPHLGQFIYAVKTAYNAAKNPPAVKPAPVPTVPTYPTFPIFREGDKVKVKAGAKAYNGGRLGDSVFKRAYTVLYVPTGDRVVIGIKILKIKLITAAVQAADLIKQK